MHSLCVVLCDHSTHHVHVGMQKHESESRSPSSDLSNLPQLQPPALQGVGVISLLLHRLLPPSKGAVPCNTLVCSLRADPDTLVTTLRNPTHKLYNSSEMEDRVRALLLCPTH